MDNHASAVGNEPTLLHGGEKGVGAEPMPEIAIVVPSCDKYADLWQPLLENMRRLWPDRFLNVHLVTNEKAFQFPGVNVIAVGPDRGWSSNLRTALERITAEGVFLLVDDLFFVEPVDSALVRRLCQRFLAEGMNYLRFNPTPAPVGWPRGRLDKDSIGEVPPGDLYRSSTVVCLWRRSVLLDVLRDGESAWDLEVFGSARTDKFGGWYASSRWVLPTTNVVIKGLYEPRAWRALKRAGVPLSDERRVMSTRQYLAFQAIRLRAAVFRLVPAAWRRSIRERFRAA